MNRADILMAAILLTLVAVAVFVASLGELMLAGRLGYFTVGVIVAFTAVRFGRSRQ